jgi:hypothetical protein
MGYRGYNEGALVVSGESTHALTGPDLKVLHPRRLPPIYRLLKEKLGAQAGC